MSNYAKRATIGVVTDSSAALVIGTSGSESQREVDLRVGSVAAGIIASDPTLITAAGALAEAARDKAAIENPVNPIGRIAVFADSMGAGSGAGSPSLSFPARLEAQIGMAVHNFGIPSENSSDIAGRQGGSPLQAVSSVGVINATGWVPITISRVSDGAVSENFARLGLDGINPVSWYGIAGRIEYSSEFSQWRFYRTNSGAVVPTPSPQPIITMSARVLRNAIQIFWAGTNDAQNSDQTIGDIAAMVQHIEALDKKFLILSPVNRSFTPAGTPDYEALQKTWRALARTYGERYLDVRTYLVKYGLAHAGITPTAQDNTDIANDVIPSSLRFDNVHLNATGYQIVADIVAKRLRELRYVQQADATTYLSRATFTAADGTLLSAYTPDSGPQFTSTGTSSIVGSKLLIPSAASPRMNVEREDVTVRADITIPAGGLTSGTYAIFCRANSAATVSLLASMSSTAVTLLVLDPAGNTTLGTYTMTPAAGSTIRLEITAIEDIVSLKVNDAEVIKRRINTATWWNQLIGNTWVGIRNTVSGGTVGVFDNWIAIPA